tara:strand:- start:57 stop:338 length:282 start_codon:yes stop_codon:yes gene_type:complete
MALRFGHIDFTKTGLFYKDKKSKSSNKTQDFHAEYDKTYMQNADDKLRQRKKYDKNVTASQKDKIIIVPKDKARGKYIFGDVLDSKKRRLKAT